MSGSRSGFRKRAALVAVVLLLAAGAVALLAARPEWLGALLFLGLTLAVGVGVVVRLIRAPKGRRLRKGFGPVAGAAETYQELLMSREPTHELIQHAFPTALDETTSSEPPKTSP